MKLTEKVITTLTCEPGKRDRLVFDDKQTGLVVRVTSTGSKSYLAQLTFRGQRRRIPIGKCSAIKLEKAREIVAKYAVAATGGIDPAQTVRKQREAAQAQAEGSSLGTLIDTWANIQLRTKSDRYRIEAPRAIKRAFRPHLRRPLQELSKRTVRHILDEMVLRGNPAMAQRTLAYGRACFAWAKQTDRADVNPFATLPGIKTNPSRERVLADDELIAIWRAAAAEPGSFGRLVQLLILLGQRRAEVAGMAWSELSQDCSTWTLPGSRTKNGKPNVLPLPEAAQAILASTHRTSDRLVFPGRFDAPFMGWNKGKLRLDAACGFSNWTLHDLRRTLATGFQRLGIRLEVTEAVLNHISGSRRGIVGVYQRHDWLKEKKEALTAWANHLTAIVEGVEPATNVVALSA